MPKCEGNTIMDGWGLDNPDIIIDCAVCGYKHVKNMPSPEQLRKLYEEEFYQNDKQEYLKSSQEDTAWRNVEFEQRYKIIEERLGKKSKSHAQLKVLDIGSGPGDFLVCGMKAGWDCVGIEPSLAAAQFAKDRGLKIINGFFDADITDTLGLFDFVHMSEVLEHVPNPIQILELAKKLLRPNGILCVSVPNDFSAIQKALIKTNAYKPWWVVPEHHLNYFNFDTVAKLLEKTGLSVFEKTTNFPMELFLLMGQNYTEDPSLGKKMHIQRKEFDLNLSQHAPELQKAFYNSLANVGMGRLAIVFAQNS